MEGLATMREFRQGLLQELDYPEKSTRKARRKESYGEPQ